MSKTCSALPEVIYIFCFQNFSKHFLTIHPGIEIFYKTVYLNILSSISLQIYLTSERLHEIMVASFGNHSTNKSKADFIVGAYAKSDIVIPVSF